MKFSPDDYRRFFSFVQKHDGCSCWFWIGPKRNHGYGMFSLGSKNYCAHRIACRMFKDPIPDGLVVDHICWQKSCVNPDHLEYVTQQENCLRYTRKITHCKNGHEFSYINEKGHRICSACKHESQLRRRAEKVIDRDAEAHA